MLDYHMPWLSLNIEISLNHKFVLENFTFFCLEHLIVWSLDLKASEILNSKQLQIFLSILSRRVQSKCLYDNCMQSFVLKIFIKPQIKNKKSYLPLNHLLSKNIQTDTQCNVSSFKKETTSGQKKVSPKILYQHHRTTNLNQKILVCFS